MPSRIRGRLRIAALKMAALWGKTPVTPGPCLRAHAQVHVHPHQHGRPAGLIPSRSLPLQVGYQRSKSLQATGSLPSCAPLCLQASAEHLFLMYSYSHPSWFGRFSALDLSVSDDSAACNCHRSSRSQIILVIYPEVAGWCRSLPYVLHHGSVAASLSPLQRLQRQHSQPQKSRKQYLICATPGVPP